MEFKLYPLEDIGRLNEICELFAKGLAETTEDLWIWKHYTENGLPKGMILVAENENGKLGGMFAMQPAYYRKGNEKVLLVQTEDLVIDPECRGQGLMRKLYDFAMDYYSKMDAKALVSYSTNAASFPIFMKYGANNLGNLNSLESVKTVVPKFWVKRYYEVSGWKISASKKMPENLFFTVKNSVWKMDKNLPFMEWKFRDNPEQKFNWLILEYQNELVGYITFYVNRGRIRSAVNICDWELKDTVNEKILKHAVKILQSYGHWVTLWGCMDTENEKLWKKAGLTEKRETESHFVYHSIGESNVLDEWYITKADSDN